RRFSRQHRIIHFATIGSASHLRLKRDADLPTPRPTCLPQDNHRLGWTTFLRHPIARLLPPRVPGSSTPPPSKKRVAGLDGLASPASTWAQDRKSTRLNSSHVKISYAVSCL